ncbi:MAG: MBL fold metallo-hydrolase [Verrucomicrobia bacterium]|nr:MBL fold metallo-hydrolase [Verrucomicrobiota bacterium]
MRLTFLGTGTSQGVPLLACSCRVCTSADPRDRRFRSSVWVEDPPLSIVIDTSPDFRSQALRAGIPRLDAVLYTHSHADHIAGFDDLRTYSVKNGNRIPIYADPFTLSRLEKAFDYAFNVRERSPAYVCPEPHPITGPFSIGPLTFTPLPVPHGTITTTGFRMDHHGQPRVAYLPDCAAVPGTIRDLIRQIPVLVIDGLREEPHPTHLTIAQAIEISQDVRAAQTWLTHLTHQTLHAERDATLPPPIRLAYDSLQLSL